VAVLMGVGSGVREVGQKSPTLAESLLFLFAIFIFPDIDT
jgi:hypothetical protein